MDSDEWIMLAPEGVCYSRTVKRLPIADQADREYLLKCIGTPWDPMAEAPRGRKTAENKDTIIVQNEVVREVGRNVVG